jgi:hypothetical protein
MISIKDIQDKDIHRRFVTLWQNLTDDYPNFQKAEQKALEDKSRHEGIKQYIKNLLMENRSMLPNKDIDESPLAILEAMDEFLVERYGAKEDAVPALIKIRGRDYILHRRIFKNHHKIRHVHQTGHIRAYLRHQP